MKKIDENKVFTLCTLRDYLNKKFKQKKSGKQFNILDIEQYVNKGHLPVYIGGFVIKEINNKNIEAKGKMYSLLNKKVSYKELYSERSLNRKNKIK